ncbi:SUKH-4 family immunity protein [Micromonospora sp. NPDC023888]|uniref:SUKH-4 family immunity protein n=1 Tax=Micromonospora sp. NPDC023888 TaxID=3155607 RepID=UPI0033DDD3B6
MNPELRELIAELRTDLEADQPATLVWAQINAGVPADTIPTELPRPVRELLETADGIRAGAFDLPDAVHIGDIQYHLAHLPEFTGVADEPSEWLVFGLLHEEPLLIRRDTGAIWYFPAETTDEWFAREFFLDVAPDLDSFLAYYVFGAGYGEIGFDDDEWWGFLGEQGLTVPGDDAEEADG